MTVKETSSGKQPADPYTLAEIRGLARLLSQFDLSEVEVEHNGQRIRLRRERSEGSGSTFLAPTIMAPAPAVPAPAPVSLATEPEKDDTTILITSPFVGTFYRAPGPEASPFVEVGQTVKKGQALCIIEAMKLMNEIEAETDGKIIDILVKNAEPVEFAQPLFKIFPLP